MTNQEAVKLIKDIRGDTADTEGGKEYYEALSMAIEALETKWPETGREGVFIPDITAEMIRYSSLEGIENLMAEGKIFNTIMPSTDRDANSMWIPVKEKPPEFPCIASDIHGNYPFIPSGLVRLGEHYCDGKMLKELITSPFEGQKVSAAYVLDLVKHNRIVAWMPLPEPYTGGAVE